MEQNKKIRQFNYPVKDLAKAKQLYSRMLGVEPYADAPYYVGYRVDDQEIGLDPNAFRMGITGPVPFFQASDIKTMLQDLVSAGAQVLQDPRDVGGGLLVAYIKDMDGNATGFLQAP